MHGLYIPTNCSDWIPNCRSAEPMFGEQYSPKWRNNWRTFLRDELAVCC
jgi:hypothetical protein